MKDPKEQIVSMSKADYDEIWEQMERYRVDGENQRGRVEKYLTSGEHYISKDEFSQFIAEKSRAEAKILLLEAREKELVWTIREALGYLRNLPSTHAVEARNILKGVFINEN